MRVEQVTRPICRARLKAGQVKRLPFNAERQVFGYYVVHECGALSVASPLNGDRVVEENGRLLEAEFECTGCKLRVAIRGGEFVEASCV